MRRRTPGVESWRGVFKGGRDGATGASSELNRVRAESEMVRITLGWEWERVREPKLHGSPRSTPWADQGGCLLRTLVWVGSLSVRVRGGGLPQGSRVSGAPFGSLSVRVRGKKCVKAVKKRWRV